MLKIIVLIFSVLLLLVGCVANGDYDADIPELNQDTSQNDLSLNSTETNHTQNEDTQNNSDIKTINDERTQYYEPISIDLAEYLFAQLHDIFEEDNGYLWGELLHTPFIFLDTETREIVANQQDPDGTFEKLGNVYLSTLPEHLIAAYSFQDFNGQRWAIMPWDMVVTDKEHPDNILRTMTHMSFHIQQPSLFGDSPGWDTSHMNQEFARVTIQLEVNALLQALRSEGEERVKNIHDALSIRVARRIEFERSKNENIFEVHEGLADYTATRLTKTDIDALLIYTEALAGNLKHVENMGGLFGYISGALYGYLLDETGIIWKEHVRYGIDLSTLLQEAHKINNLLSFDELDLTSYGYEEIVTAEAVRLENYLRLLDDISKMFLQEPTLRIPSSYDSGDMMLNPSRIFQVPGVGEVYGATVVISGIFGTLELYDGYFARSNSTYDGRIIATDMVIEGNRASSSGWLLALEDGFEIRPEGTNYTINTRSN